MDRENRKATDVLLDLESKVEMLLQIIRSQDLNIKLLSNKLNIVIEKIEKQPVTTPKIMVEAVNNIPQTPVQQLNSISDNQIPISADFSVPTETSPKGFRRTSRPETFSGDDMYLNREPERKLPLQIPNSVVNKIPNKLSDNAEVIVNDTSFQERLPVEAEKPERSRNPNSVPVVQRIVDKNGKSVFLADVEIFDSTNNLVSKTRTNGTGKWMSTLPLGPYKVFIRKRESLSKEKIEAVQNIEIDGMQSPLELQTMIIR